MSSRKNFSSFKNLNCRQDACATAAGLVPALPKSHAIEQPPWRGWAITPFDSKSLRPFLADPLKLFDLPDTELIKVSRNRLARVRLKVGSKRFAWVVKEFSNRSVGAFLKNSWRQSKAAKGWTKARALVAREIGTPMPRLALDRRGQLGLVVTSVLVVDDLGEVIQLRRILKHFRKPDNALAPLEKEPFLQALADFVRHMHNQGVLHRDLSGGNVLVRFDKGGRCEFFLVDINRAKVAPVLRAKERLLDLERINVAPDDRRFFFSAYCRRSQRLLMLESQYLRRVEIYRSFREGRSFRYRLTKYLPGLH